MTVWVWVPHGEIYCCGAPFAVGDDVRWTVEERIDDAVWLAELFGRPVVPQLPVRYYARHIGVADDPVVGRVRSIDAVRVGWVAVGGLGSTFETKPGSGVASARLSAPDPWRAPENEEDVEDPEPIGYLVELDDGRDGPAPRDIST